MYILERNQCALRVLDVFNVVRCQISIKNIYIYIYIYIYICIYIYRGNPLMSGQPRNRSVGMNW